MSVFTTVTKKALSWEATPNSNVPTQTVFTTLSKSFYQPIAPTTSVDFVFSDGLDFLFSDGSDYLFKA